MINHAKRAIPFRNPRNISSFDHDMNQGVHLSWSLSSQIVGRIVPVRLSWTTGLISTHQDQTPGLMEENCHICLVSPLVCSAETESRNAILFAHCIF